MGIPLGQEVAIRGDYAAKSQDQPNEQEADEDQHLLPASEAGKSSTSENV